MNFFFFRNFSNTFKTLSIHLRKAKNFQMQMGIFDGQLSPHPPPHPMWLFSSSKMKVHNMQRVHPLEVRYLKMYKTDYAYILVSRCIYVWWSWILEYFIFFWTEFAYVVGFAPISILEKGSVGGDLFGCVWFHNFLLFYFHFPKIGILSLLFWLSATFLKRLKLPYFTFLSRHGCFEEG